MPVNGWEWKYPGDEAGDVEAVIEDAEVIGGAVLTEVEAGVGAGIGMKDAAPHITLGKFLF